MAKESANGKSASVCLPAPLAAIFAAPRGAVRFRCAWGGRGSGKSYSFALMALAFGYAERLRILATREYQVSIRESFHAELARVIGDHAWLARHYTVNESSIFGANGTEFIFRGLRKNIESIKSMSGIDIAIVEEAEAVPERSWQALLPTVRGERSEVWAIWNPEREGSPIDLLFRKRPPPDAAVAEVHYWDNPWFPSVLDRQRRHDQARLDVATYAHIWEGAYMTNSRAQILADRVRVDEFEPERGKWDGPYFGIDWGFAQDPLAAVRVWIHDDRLWVEAEAGGVGIEIDETPRFLRARLPEIERYPARADSARPETISYVRRNGLPNVTAVAKWPQSIEDGIAYLRSFREIVIHPRCAETIRETRLYSYKTDRLTGDVLPEIIDSCNHYIDAIRYALQPMIRQRTPMASAARVPGL